MNYELYHFGVKGMKWGVRKDKKPDGSLTAKGKKKYSNRHIEKDMNEFYNKTYKELYSKYEKTNRATAADRAHTQAKKLNTKHLVDTYGKERMDKYYASERKKAIAAGSFLVGSLAAMSVTALVADRIG